MEHPTARGENRIAKNSFLAMKGFTVWGSECFRV
jgi:hypothetical protein